MRARQPVGGSRPAFAAYRSCDRRGSRSTRRCGGRSGPAATVDRDRRQDRKLRRWQQHGWNAHSLDGQRADDGIAGLQFGGYSLNRLAQLKDGRGDERVVMRGR
jgi:hypothetical protein